MSANNSPKLHTNAVMTKPAAARIQSATAKSNGGHTPKGSFASRAASVASRNGK